MSNSKKSMHDWTQLIQHLKSIQPFCYVHNYGNAGDSLIYKGMVELFASQQLQYVEVSSESTDLSGQHVVYSGGGNLVPLYWRCRKLLESQMDCFGSFTLLPHTVDGNEDLLAKMDSRFHLYCRDLISYEHCRKHTPESVQVELSHDLAFALQAGDGCRVGKPGFWFPHASLDRQLKWYKKKRDVQHFLRQGGVCFYRTDKESKCTSLPEVNLDLSAVLSALQRRHAQRLMIAETALYYLGQAERISTDRLHLGIGGALLGIETELSAGSYYKNEAIFEHSIRDYFTTVRFNGA